MTTPELPTERADRKRKLREELNRIEAAEKAESDAEKEAQRQRNIEANKTKHGREYDSWYAMPEASINRQINETELKASTLRSIRDAVYPKPKFTFGFNNDSASTSTPANPPPTRTVTCDCGATSCSACTAKKLRFGFETDTAVTITPPTNVRSHHPFGPRGGTKVIHFGAAVDPTVL